MPPLFIPVIVMQNRTTKSSHTTLLEVSVSSRYSPVTEPARVKLWRKHARERQLAWPNR
jgi:hypothetical protein